MLISVWFGSLLLLLSVDVCPHTTDCFSCCPVQLSAVLLLPGAADVCCSRSTFWYSMPLAHPPDRQRGAATHGGFAINWPFEVVCHHHHNHRDQLEGYPRGRSIITRFGIRFGDHRYYHYHSDRTHLNVSNRTLLGRNRGPLESLYPFSCYPGVPVARNRDNQDRALES